MAKAAQCLNARGFTTPNKKAFKAQSVKNLLDRIAIAVVAPEKVSKQRKLQPRNS